MCTCTHDCRHDNQHLVHTRTRRGASISCNASESEPSASTIKQRNRKRCWNQTGQGFSHRQCCQNDDPCQHERTRGKGKKVQKKHRHQLQVVQVQVHVSNKLKYTRYTAYLFLLLLLSWFEKINQVCHEKLFNNFLFPVIKNKFFLYMSIIGLSSLDSRGIYKYIMRISWNLK